MRHHSKHWSRTADETQSRGEIRSRLKDLMEGNLPKGAASLIETFGQKVLSLAHWALPEFATLAPDFIDSIIDLQDSISQYVGDASLRRPHNILMAAQSGIGKSHFVKCLGKKLGMPVVTANLATADAIESLSVAVNEARNWKAKDLTPLIFLDELDSQPDMLPMLLPLMWDGQFVVDRQSLEIGRCVIVCAVSDPKLCGFAQNGSYERDVVKRYGVKIIDFRSRLDGGILEMISINEERRKLDKPCIAIDMIQRRFPRIREVQLCLLRFVYECSFTHEVRSLEVLISKIPQRSVEPDWDLGLFTVYYLVEPNKFDYITDLFTDFNRSPLRYHIPLSCNPLELWKKVVSKDGGECFVECERFKV